MYALFAGLMYYPEGGWGDHRLTTPDLSSAQAEAKNAEHSADWWHIIHVPTGMVIERWATDIYDKAGPLADA
ncbi:hypothetical protein MKK88_00960 [Methylobacterium sp. E-005]|uniref:hypothetical protein n=1 Tax=Methylobacterium sp. E-005 TaxID=2836549 RepID=UPI001FB96B90|nr:hypothetical protein [Methylobacterium sp. E-005]MCJ2084565.1 hypothetical protein [Methylobacterium sp. E-005]